MNKKLLVCCTDAGGAANILPVIDYCNNQPISVFLLTGENTKKYFFNYKKDILKNEVQRLDDAICILSKIKPNILFCGTARLSESPENLLIKAAEKLNIFSIAYIDEWYNYKNRFFDKNTGNLHLPNKIAVNDKLAKFEATQEGIPNDRCVITGSPALERIIKKYQKYLNNNPSFPDYLTNDRIIITFLSETHSKDFGEKPGESGISGSYLGYTEEIVLNDLILALKNVNKKCYLIEKIHPSDSRDYCKKVINDNITHISIKDCDLSILLWYSHLIIGMTSISLLESAFMNKPIISYQPNLVGKNNCTASRLGAIDMVNNNTEFNQWIDKELKSINSIDVGMSLQFLDCINQDATLNIIKLMELD